MNTSTFKLSDKIVMVCILVISGLLMAWNTFGAGSAQQLTAVITHDGKLIKTIDLSDLNKIEKIDLAYEGVHQVIRAENSRIRFVESDCPNKICVKTGWLTKPSDTAVCLPSRVIIRLVGDNKPADVSAY